MRTLGSKSDEVPSTFVKILHSLPQPGRANNVLWLAYRWRQFPNPHESCTHLQRGFVSVTSRLVTLSEGWRALESCEEDYMVFCPRSSLNAFLQSHRAPKPFPNGGSLVHALRAPGMSPTVFFQKAVALLTFLYSMGFPVEKYSSLRGTCATVRRT